MTNIIVIMPKKAPPAILPKVEHRLREVGEQIRMARLRRNFTAEIVSERSFIGRDTFRKIEKGDPSVTMGAYASVLHSLGLENDLRKLAQEDLPGRELEDVQTMNRQRASSRKRR